MRIVSGILRGRQINPPSGFDARPTTDFAKEALFNILNNHFDFEECCALDLFAGSGNISYEFISRACKSVTAVEIHAKYASFIERTAASFHITSLQVLKADAYRYLQHCTRRFNIIFADPPYSSGRYEEIHRFVFQNNLLMPDGVLILEHNKDVDLRDLKYFEQTKKYAGVMFSFFWNMGE
ncbi:MAG TPA: RsmD family RNA methyltransferase [Bacteroidales bacterium]|nr:RsmD family RNA methyltransferase [Bacteroidales bacterium]